MRRARRAGEMTKVFECPQREAAIDACAGRFDAAIIGGGITGASLYDRMCREGYRVLLVDRGDFGSGTSQASAMMIWGGLLYLRQLDFGTVWNVVTRARRSDRRSRVVGPNPEVPLYSGAGSR